MIKNSTSLAETIPFKRYYGKWYKMDLFPDTRDILKRELALCVGIWLNLKSPFS